MKQGQEDACSAFYCLNKIMEIAKLPTKLENCKVSKCMYACAHFDVNILLFNNEIYGLTKGQYSPTSRENKITKSALIKIKEEKERVTIETIVN